MTTPDPPPGPRQLDRAPGERYRARPGAADGGATSSTPGEPAAAPIAIPWSRRRRVGLAVAVAIAGGLVTLVLAGFDLGPGLLAIGAGAGWATGLVLAGGAAPGRGPDAGTRRAAGGAALAAGGIALGLLGDGVRALTEGGVLGPVAYLGERYGWLAPLVVLVAGVAGALRGR